MAVQVLDAGRDVAGKSRAQATAAPVEPATAPWLVVTVLASLAAAWVAASSVGLLAHSLRHSLDWVLLATILAAAWPSRWTWRSAIAVIGAMVVAIAMTASWVQAVNVLAPAVLLAALALAHPRERQVFSAVAGAIVVFAVWRLALTSIPALWLLADGTGRAIGQIVGTLAGQAMWLGATYGGLDFLVLMLALCATWMMLTPAPRGRRILFAIIAILLAQGAYLFALAFVPRFLPMLPPPGQPNPANPFQQDVKNWADMVRDFVPWNLPVFCAILQMTVAGLMLSWSPVQGEEQPAGKAARAPRGGNVAVNIFCAILAAALPAMLVMGSKPQTQLQGKKIVFYEKGFLNWMRPEHPREMTPGGPREGGYGRLSQGMYGMMPSFIQSLGGRMLISPDLTADDLKDADVLVILYPNHPWSDWKESKGQLRRIWDFVQRGGSLLIFSDHTIREPDGRNRANDLLRPGQFARSRRKELAEYLRFCKEHSSEIAAGKPVAGVLPFAPLDYGDEPKGYDEKPARLAYDATHEAQARKEYDLLGQIETLPDSAMRVRFDAAEFIVGGWLQSYEALSHPTSTGMHDDRNQFGVVIGASMEARYPAKPLLVGRWGWIDEGDAGSSTAMLGNHKYDPGEKLGDMILAAEQRIGKGRIIAFADTSSMTNGINIGAHEYTGRLMTYLAGGGSNPQNMPRQFLGAIGAIALVIILLRAGNAWGVGITAMVMALSLSCCTSWTYALTEPVPDGAKITLDHPKTTSDPVSGRAQTPWQEFWPAPPKGPSRLIYFDVSHLPEASEEGWRPDGTMGLAMSFMREGYLALQLFDLDKDRLDKASFYVVVAPSRHYTDDEREMIKEWVNNGGTLIVTAGWDKASATQELLDDYGLYIGIEKPVADKPTKAPEPLGFFKSPYYSGPDYQCFVRFWAAWPVGPDPTPAPPTPNPFLPPGALPATLPTVATTQMSMPDLLGKTSAGPIPGAPDASANVAQPQAVVSDVHVIATGMLNGRAVPVILWKGVGQGKVVLAGDTSFVMNKNLETENGDLFDQMRENSDFWRWFIPQLNGTPPWYPPKQVPLDPNTGLPLPPTATQPATQPEIIPMTQPAGLPVPDAQPATQPTPATQPAEVKGGAL
jgi:hypothetical protein